MAVFTSFILDILLYLYQHLGDLGLVIIVFTVVLRTILLPLTVKSLRAASQIRDLQPELKKLKEKHKEDKQALQKAQLELYQKYNINPLAGCLPQVLQLVLLILLYQVLLKFLGNTEINGIVIDPTFLWLDLSKPDSLYILPVVAGASQLVLSLMIAPGGEVKDQVSNTSSDPKIKAENKKEEDFAEMAASMQQQMIFIMPFMTGFIALTFPSGLALYWVVTTIYSIGQQWAISGPGGLVTYSRRALAWLNLGPQVNQTQARLVELGSSKAPDQTKSASKPKKTTKTKKISSTKKKTKAKKSKAKTALAKAKRSKQKKTKK